MPSSPTSDRWRWPRRLAPWVITIAVVVALLIQYPIGRIVDEMQRGDTLAMIPAAISAAVLLWFNATVGDMLLFRPVLGPIGWFELMRGKAGVSVLQALGAIVNYGGFALWLQRRFGCKPGTAAGLLLFILFSDLCAVSLLATGAVWLGGDTVPVDVRDRIGIAAPIVAVVTMVIVMLGPPPRSERHVFDPWRRIPRPNRLAGVIVRCGNITILIGTTWFAAQAFGIPLPLGAVFTYLPILLVIAAIPVNIAGFGPIQAMWITVFSPWAPGEQVLAFQFLWHLLAFSAIVARGAPFLRGVVGDVTRKKQR